MKFFFFFQNKKNQLFSICFKNRKKKQGEFSQNTFFRLAFVKNQKTRKCVQKHFSKTFFKVKKSDVCSESHSYMFFFYKKGNQELCFNKQIIFFFFGIAFVLKCVGLLVYDSLRT